MEQIEEAQKHVDTDVGRGIREMPVSGFIRFSIKCNDTKENQAIHDAFKEFCRLENDDNYTQGLKRLLESYQHNSEIDAIWNAINGLQTQLNELIEANKPKEEDTEGAF